MAVDCVPDPLPSSRFGSNCWSDKSEFNWVAVVLGCNSDTCALHTVQAAAPRFQFNMGKCKLCQTDWSSATDWQLSMVTPCYRFFRCPAMAPVDPAPWPPRWITQRKKRLDLYLFITKAGQEVCLSGSRCWCSGCQGATDELSNTQALYTETDRK